MSIAAYSPFDFDVKQDPYPFYAWLRQTHPVYHNEQFDFWALSRYEDVVTAARHSDLFSSAQGVGPDKRYGLSMITNDPPIHTRLRKLVNKAFTPKRIDRLAARIQTIVDALLDDIVAKGEFDLIDDFAIPLPVTVIAEVLGVAPERRDDFRRWSDDVVHFAGGVSHGNDRAQLRQSWDEFRSCFGDIMAARRREPRDDIISVLVQAQEDQQVLSDLELFNFLQLLLVGGNETTTNLIANGALACTHHPAQWQKLRQQPDLVPNLIEEVLRYDAPIQLVFRTTTQDVEMHGTTIPADSKVALLWGAANRDPDVFPDPDRFDITRSSNHHIAFGSGIHYCLGASLARLEARIAATTILRRLPYMRLIPHGVCKRIDNPLLRGLRHFPMVADAAADNTEGAASDGAGCG